MLVLSIHRGAERIIVPSTDLKFRKEDKMTIVGKTEDIKHFEEHFKMNTSILYQNLYLSPSA